MYELRYHLTLFIAGGPFPPGMGAPFMPPPGMMPPPGAMRMYFLSF